MEKTQTTAEKPPLVQVYETPHYRVVIGKLLVPEGTDPALGIKYIIQHKKHGVVLGSTSSYGMAVATALEEEGRHLAADEVAAEAAERGFTLLRDETPTSFGTKQ